MDKVIDDREYAIGNEEDDREYSLGSAIPRGEYNSLLTYIDSRVVEVELTEDKLSLLDPPPKVAAELRSDTPQELQRLWAAREQGIYRGTCVAFAVSALVELYGLRFGGNDPIEHLSEEFLYATMRNECEPTNPETIPNYANGATLIEQAFEALIEFGICSADLMRYNLRPRNPAHTEVVPAAATTDAESRKVAPHDLTAVKLPPDKRRPTGLQLSSIFAGWLSQRVPVSVALPIFPRGAGDAWSLHNAVEYGVVPDPHGAPDIRDAMGGHAVCLTHYVSHPTDPDTDAGRFTFKNSWGTRFAPYAYQYGGFGASPGVGYGTISGKHLSDYCWEYIIRH